MKNNSIQNYKYISLEFIVLAKVNVSNTQMIVMLKVILIYDIILKISLTINIYFTLNYIL